MTTTFIPTFILLPAISLKFITSLHLCVLLCWNGSRLLPLPDDYKTLIITSSEKRFIIVEAHTKHWTGVPLKLVEARLLLTFYVQEVHTWVLTSCNLKRHKVPLVHFFHSIGKCTLFKMWLTATVSTLNANPVTWRTGIYTCHSWSHQVTGCWHCVLCKFHSLYSRHSNAEKLYVYCVKATDSECLLLFTSLLFPF